MLHFLSARRVDRRYIPRNITFARNMRDHSGNPPAPDRLYRVDLQIMSCLIQLSRQLLSGQICGTLQNRSPERGRAPITEWTHHLYTSGNSPSNMTTGLLPLLHMSCCTNVEDILFLCSYDIQQTFAHKIMRPANKDYDPTIIMY